MVSKTAHPHRTVRTIHARFDPRDNAITPLRLLLALVVVFSHSFPAGGFGFDPLHGGTGGQMQLGSLAVAAFFGLSGFLLTAARQRHPPAVFAWHRALRIAPALVVCVAATATVFVPLSEAMTGTEVEPTVVRWATAVLTFQIVVPTIEGLWSGAPTSHVNASLWTLSYEVWCYVAVLVAPTKRTGLVLATLLGVTLWLHVAADGQALGLHLPLAFAMGGLLQVGAGRVPLHGGIAAALIAAVAIAAALDGLALLAPVALPYAALWLAVVLPCRWRQDVSYGAYIYAWPVQQLLVLAGVAAWGWSAYFGVTLPIVLAVAYVSARVVEEPALRMRGWLDGSVGLQAAPTAPRSAW